MKRRVHRNKGSETSKNRHYKTTAIHMYRGFCSTAACRTMLAKFTIHITFNNLLTVDKYNLLLLMQLSTNIAMAIATYGASYSYIAI